MKQWVEEEQREVEAGLHGEGVRTKVAEGVVYKKMEFVAANRDVLGVLQSVAQQVALFFVS